MTSWEYIKFGDSEAALINLLLQSDEITDFPGGNVNVKSDYKGFNDKVETARRWIMVTREGGSMNWPKVDKPRIDLQVLAETRTIAHDLAQVAQAVIIRAMGQAFPEYGLRITDVRVETGITRVPDKETGSFRYIFALRLTCVPFS